MKELVLEGRVSLVSDGAERVAARTVELKRAAGSVGLVAAVGLAAAAVVAAVLATLALAAAVAGVRWAARRREQGLDDPLEVVRMRARQAREWIETRREPENQDDIRR